MVTVGKEDAEHEKVCSWGIYTRHTGRSPGSHERSLARTGIRGNILTLPETEIACQRRHRHRRTFYEVAVLKCNPVYSYIKCQDRQPGKAPQRLNRLERGFLMLSSSEADPSWRRFMTENTRASRERRHDFFSHSC